MRTRTVTVLLAILLAPAAFARAHKLELHRTPARQQATTVLYYGGPVIQNPKVYVAWWGGAAGVSTRMTMNPGGAASFYDGVLDSLFIDPWAQFDTDITAQAGSKQGVQGTNQLIGRGNFAGAFDLTTVPSGNVTDEQVQTSLEAAVTAGTLPPADANTIYAIYFPASVTITLPDPDGGPSCGDFGAYHDQTVAKGYAYLVIPDCGYKLLDFQHVSSHELAEATTDLVPTPGSEPDYPQAWNDNMGNEVADLCQSTGALISTGSGQFGVQGIWDPRSGSCQTTPHAPTDFSVALSPHAWKMATNSTATLNVQTAIVAGAAQTLALTVTAPPGLTATLASSSVQTGDAVALTLASTTALRDGQVIISATASSGAMVWTHTAALLVNVAAVADDFSLAIASPSVNGVAGSMASYTIQTQVLSGSVPPLALSVTNLPVASQATFTPASIDAGDSSTLTISTLFSQSGTIHFQVVATGDLTHVADATLVLPTVDAGTDAGTDAGSTPDAGGSPDAGPTDGGAVTQPQTSSSGCSEAPIEALVLPLVGALWMAFHARRRADS